jgi:hypothetical protein
MALSTKLSSISWVSTTLASVGSFTFSNQRDALEVTELGYDYRAYISGIQGATASCEIFYDQGQATHQVLEAAITNGVAQTLVITASTGMTYTATAICTRFEITGQAGDVIRAAVDFQCTGAVTIA